MADVSPSPATIQPASDEATLRGQVDLRPLTTSELIDRGFMLYRAHFAGLFLLALLCQTAPLLCQVLITTTGITPTQADLLDNFVGCLVRLGGMLIAILVAQLIVFGFKVVLTFYISDAYLGKIPSVRTSLRKLATRVGASIWTFGLSLILILLTFIFPVMVMVAAYVYTVKFPPADFLSVTVFAMVGLLLFIASLIPVLVVFMRIWVIIPPFALERLSGWKAVWRSVELVRYDPGLGILYWGEMRLSFLLLPLFAIELLILSLTSLPLTIVEFSEALRHGTGQFNAPPDATMVISTILTFLAGSLILPLYPIATTIFYYDIRIRREGFDLEFMAENLGGGPQMKRALLVLALGCLGVISVRAADEDSAPGSRPKPVTDPARVAAYYHEILQKPEFHDSREVDVDEQFRDMLAQWFFTLGKKMSRFKYVSEMSRVASIMLTGMVILCIAGVIYVIARVCRRQAELDLDNTADMPGQKTFRPPEFYEKEIQEAIHAANWHAAWLATWRQFLSRLENRQLVEADRTRTNREYLAQLRERTLPSPALALLTALVESYDLFIYGHRPIAELDWDHFHRKVSEAGLLLHLDDRGLQSKPVLP